MFPNVSFACRIFAAAYIKQQSLTFPQQRPTIGAQLGVRNILMCVCLKTTVANSTCQAINYWWTDKPGRQTTALLLLLLLFLLLHYLLQPLLLLQQQCAHLKDCNRTHTYKTAIHQADTIAQDNNNSMCRWIRSRSDLIIQLRFWSARISISIIVAYVCNTSNMEKKQLCRRIFKIYTIFGSPDIIPLHTYLFTY